MTESTPDTRREAVEALSQIQRERLAYIEFRLYFLGEIGRTDLSKRFGVAPAAATRDFSLYRELFPENIEFDNTSKLYVISDHFQPGFEHVPERVLTALSMGFGDGVNPAVGPLIPCEVPVTLNRPKMDVLAPLTRAIHLHKPLKVRYTSYSSGESEREIVPFAIATDGLRWHARAYCRSKRRFTDFVVSRMAKPTILMEDTIQPDERPSADIQWNRIVELDLIPHPDRDHPEIAALDFGMTGGVLHLKLRAAMAGYVLRQWHVDCSADHKLTDKAFRLWLSDPLTLYGVESADFAPAYTRPETSVPDKSVRE